jgi:hypothetical protein
LGVSGIVLGLLGTIVASTALMKSRRT